MPTYNRPFTFSLPALRQAAKRLELDKRIKVYSEPDQGIYDAMNRAIAYARGQYLVFMNCGDLFSDERVLERIYEALAESADPDILYGNFEIDKIVYEQTTTMTDFYLFRTPLNHQSMFIKKEAFDRLEMYDCDYKILADYEFTVRCWYNKLCFIHANVIVCRYLGGGISESKSGVRIREVERRTILRKYFSTPQRLLYNMVLLISLRKFRIWMLSGSCPYFIRKGYRKLVNVINNK